MNSLGLDSKLQEEITAIVEQKNFYDKLTEDFKLYRETHAPPIDGPDFITYLFTDRNWSKKDYDSAVDLYEDLY